MSTSLFGTIATSWRKPKVVMTRLVEGGLSEARALIYLMLACLLFFVASTPNALRVSPAIDDPDANTISVTAFFFGMMFVAPLMFYAVAPVLHLVARAVGGTGSWLGARTALFWSLLQVAVLTIPVSLIGAALDYGAPAAAGAVRDVLGIAAVLLWIWWLSVNFAVVESLRSPVGMLVPLGVLLFVLPVSLRWML